MSKENVLIIVSHRNRTLEPYPVLLIYTIPRSNMTGNRTNQSLPPFANV